MKFFSKLIGLLLLGLLLLLVVAGFALTQFFDPNDYKNEIRDLARKHGNIELELNGEIGWSIFPWLGIEITDAKIASTATPDDPFADLRLLGLSVQVLPLLRKEIQMSNIRVDGLNLYLHRNAQGQANWEQIGRSSQDSAITVGTESAADSSNSANQPKATVLPTQRSTPLRLDINSLIVNGARVDYHDEHSGQQFNLESVQFTTGAIRGSEPVAIKFSGFFGNAKPLLRTHLELTAKASIDQVLRRYLLDNVKLSGEVSGEPLKGKTANYTARGNLLYDQSANIARWDNLKLSVNQLKAIGELQAVELNKEPQLSGALSIAAVNLHEFLTGVGIELPEMADKKALNHFEFNARLQGTANSLLFNDMALSIDQTAVTGSAGIKDLNAAMLYAHLSADKLDADRYLPVSEKKAPTERQVEVKKQTAQVGIGVGDSSSLPRAPSNSAWSTEQMLPIERLRKVNADLDLAFAQLTINALDISQAKLNLLAQQGVLTLNNLQGNLFNGEFQTSASLDTTAAQPLLTLKHRTQNMPVEKILTALDEEVMVTGLLDNSMELRSRGNSQYEWIEHLNGKLDFALHEGVLPGADLERQLCMGIATLNRKRLAPSTGSKDTRFNDLRGSLSIRNGIAHNPDLRVAIPGLSVKGRGDINLRVLSLDYFLGVLITGNTQAMADPACKVSKNFANIEWPLRCRGPLELGAKACRIDQDALGKIAAGMATERISDKINERIEKKVSPELQDALRGLFNR